MEELKMIENELVPVYETSTGEKVVYGSELHEVLQVKSRFNDWVRNRLNDCEAAENADYDTFTKNLVSGGKCKEYIIKLDTAKEMAMLERNEKGKQVRRYFIEVEKKYKKQNEFNTEEFSPLLRLLMNMELKQKETDKKLDALEQKSEKQTEVIQTVKETLTGTVEDFRKWAVDTISAIATSPNYGQTKYKYQEAWGESYKRLTDKAGCNLDTLLKNARKRAKQNGASRTQLTTINKLSIISENKRLKEIYVSILREMTIAYCVEVA